MDKKILKIIVVIGMVILLNLLLTTVSNATISISTSKSSVSPGETFSVTVSVNSNEAGHITLSASNGTLSNTNIDLMSSTSSTVSCTAGSSGTITINATGIVANYDTETEGTQTASPKTVSIIVPQAEPEPEPQPPIVTPSKSSNANLSNLGINPYDFRGFKAATTSYSVSVPSNVSKVSIYATTQDSKAKVSGTGNKNLNVGKNTFNVVVTAEDGTTKTYTLYITREQEENVTNKPNTLETAEKSSDALLSILSVEEGAITPEFNTEIKEYTINVSEKITEIHITAIANNEKAVVNIEGGIDLQLGENIVNIIVSAEDGTSEIYTIKVMKQNNKIALSALVAGSINNEGVYTELPISPLFNEDILEYTLDDIENNIDSLKINALPNSQDLIVEIEGNENLREGKNIIIITVKKAIDNQTTEGVQYKIIVNKKEAPKVGIMGKVKNSIIGFFGGIKNYINTNREMIIFSSLAFCSGAMFAIFIYLVIEYKRYKMLLAKIATLVKENASMRNNEINKIKNKVE